MKRILYIATSDISLRTGGGMANLALLKSLCKKYADFVDVIHYEKNIDKEKYPYNMFFVPSISNIEKLKNILHGRIHRFTPWFDDFLQKKGCNYSHCIINSGIMGEYVDVLHRYGIKVMVIHHNYESEFQMDNKRPSTLFGLTDCFVKRSERLSYENSDFNVFLSYDDISVFHEKYNKKHYCNECAIGIFQPEPCNSYTGQNEPLNSSRLCICGSLNSVQTRKGLKDFKDNYYEILSSCLGVHHQLKIAGRAPSEDLIAWGEVNPNIMIIPNPADMYEAVKDCGIFVCPTNVGGGIKLRILDGLSAGMPILTHAISARGYNNLHKYNWFQIYNDKESFERGLKTIISEIANNGNLRDEIRESYDKYFSIEHGDAKFLSAVELFLS